MPVLEACCFVHQKRKPYIPTIPDQLQLLTFILHCSLAQKYKVLHSWFDQSCFQEGTPNLMCSKQNPIMQTTCLFASKTTQQQKMVTTTPPHRYRVRVYHSQQFFLGVFSASIFPTFWRARSILQVEGVFINGTDISKQKGDIFYMSLNDVTRI